MLNYLEKHKVILVYIPLTIYWLLLLTATSLPAAELPSIGTVDKVNHFIAYFGLSVLLNLALLFQTKWKFLYQKAFMISFIIVITYGLLDEIHQIFIPGRFAEVYDWLADAAGALVGISLVRFIVNKLSYNSEKFGRNV